MIFQLVLAVCLFSSFGDYGVSGFAFLLYGHWVSPQIQGTCFYAVCENSQHNVTSDCFKKHIDSKGQVISVPCGLELKKGKTDEFWKTDGEGKRTGDSATIKKYGNTMFVYVRKNKQGETNECICGTYSNILEPEEKVLLEILCECAKPKYFVSNTIC